MRSSSLWTSFLLIVGLLVEAPVDDGDWREDSLSSPPLAAGLPFRLDPPSKDVAVGDEPPDDDDVFLTNKDWKKLASTSCDGPPPPAAAPATPGWLTPPNGEAILLVSIGDSGVLGPTPDADAAPPDPPTPPLPSPDVKLDNFVATEDEFVVVELELDESYFDNEWVKRVITFRERV